MKKVQLTHKLIESLKKLSDGERIPASQLKYSWVKSFVQEKLLIDIPHGIQHEYKISNRESFLKALKTIDPMLSDIKTAEFLLDNPDAITRAGMARTFGDSKALKHRTAYGFMVNSFEPLDAELNGQPITIAPPPGSYVFIADTEHFNIPEDIIVVGIENMENFFRIREQRDFLEHNICRILGSCPPILFASRYPQNTSLREWLKARENTYIHFGDYDLAGIDIFLTEFYKHLPNRAHILIPDNIESCIRLYGSEDLYDNHYEKYHNIKSTIPDVQRLIDLINANRKGLEQEVFINQSL